jgi:imidazolonepropionase
MVLDNIGVLATNDTRFPGLTGRVTDAAVAVRRGEVVWAGPRERLPQGLDPLPRLDCEGRAVVPGFVDAHCHLLHAGDDSEGFARRLVGIDPIEPASGGGRQEIHRAGQALGDADKNELVASRLTRMLEHGTTTAEAAGGFALDPGDEADWRRIAASLDRTQPVDLVVTADLADLPLRSEARHRMLTHVCSELREREIGDGDTIRIHVGKDHLTGEEARLVASAARQSGYRMRLHAGRTAEEEILRLLAEDPVAIDHGGRLPVAVMDRLAAAGVSVILTPGAGLAHRETPADGPALWASGVTMGLATDGSPLTMQVESMQMVIALAVLVNGFTADQALWAATRGSALALGLEDRGWIGAGTLADLVILDAPDPTHLAYRAGTNLAWKVLKHGALVAR